MEVSQVNGEKENVPSYFPRDWFEDELEEVPRVKPLQQYVPLMRNDYKEEADAENCTAQQDVPEYKHFIHETGEVFAVLENMKYEYTDNTDYTAKEELTLIAPKDENVDFSLVEEPKIQFHDDVSPEDVQNETVNTSINHEELDKVESDAPVYSCIKCSQTFPSEQDFQRHHRVDTGSCLYRCSQCEKMFTCKKNLARHQLLHTGNLPHKCDKCDKSYLDKCSLKRHSLLHLDGRPFTCTECQKSFSRRHDYNLHMLIHNRTEFKCDVCERTYINKHNLKRHKLAAHPQC